MSQSGIGTQPKDVTLDLHAAKSKRRALVYRLDADHGSLLKAYAAMGSPVNPTHEQIEKLKEAAKLPAPESVAVKDGKLAFHLEPEALLLSKFVRR